MREVDAVRAALDDDDGLVVGDEDEAARDRRDVTAERRRRLGGGPRRRRELPDAPAHPGARERVRHALRARVQRVGALHAR